MEYTFGHYGIVCNPDYRYERDFSESKYNCDITYGYEGGYFINFFDAISGGHITYNKAVITDEEAKEILKETLEKKMLDQINELKANLLYINSL
jgi:hypothetical protein